MFEDRVACLREILKAHGLAGVALTPGPSLRYATGANLPHGDRLCIAYIPAADEPIVAVVPAFETANWSADVSLPSKVFGWEDTDGPEAAIAEAFDTVGAGDVGVDALTFSYRDFAAMKRAATHLNIQDAQAALAEHRLHKSAEEAGYIREAARIAEAALDDTLEAVAPGKAEAEIGALLCSRLFARGGEQISFGPIVLTGAKSAMPHGVPDDTPIENEALLLFDFGTSHKGYHCDITRTFYVGASPSDEVRAMYEAVRIGNERGRAAAKPGVTCHDVHEAAQAHFHEPPFIGDLKHRTGHGLGLDVHEPPSIMPGNYDTLTPGMLFTIEPGLYREGVGGVRIEDDIWITTTAHESVTTYPRDLRCIG